MDEETAAAINRQEGILNGYDKETGEVITVTPGYPPEIAKAIVAVMAEVRMLGVDEKNPHGGYAYVSVDKFYDVIGRMMAAHGLSVVIDETDTDVREGAKGNPWLFARYSLTFLHESGAMSAPVRRSIALPISGPQTFGAAQSYIDKQFLRQVFKVPTGERDADETDNTPKAEPPPTRTAAAFSKAVSDGIGADLKKATQHAAARQMLAPQSGVQQTIIPPPIQQPGVPTPPARRVNREEAWARYQEFRGAVSQATSEDALDAMFGSNDWSELALDLAGIGEQKRINGLIAMRDAALDRLRA
jgi:hypothetical protein